MKLIIIICMAIVLETSAGVLKMIHPSVKICKRNDPELSKCFKENFVNLLRIIKGGLPEMNIISITPVKVDSLVIDFSSSQSVQLKADLFNMTVLGFDNVKLNKVEVEVVPEGLKMYIDMLIPKLIMSSDYNATGKLLLLEVDSNGDFHGEFDNVDYKSKWWTEPYMKNGKTHLKWDNSVEELKIGKMHMHFNRLFANNTELTDHTNKVINENMESLYDDIQPVIQQTFTSVANNIINNVYALFPYDILFPKA